MSQEWITRLERFEIAPDEFDHEAHVQAAWECLREEGLEAGSRRFVRALSRYVAHHGVAEKYHDTLTRALLHIIHDRLSGGLRDERWEGFRARCPELFEAPGALLERHYSKALLGSDAARAMFVMPDRAPLPVR